MRAEQADAPSIVVARHEQRRRRPAERVIDAAKERLHLGCRTPGIDPRGVEEIAGDDDEIDRAPAPRPLALDGKEQRAEDRIGLGRAREQMQIGEMQDDRDRRREARSGVARKTRA
jgi:hypothetical protein